MEVSATCTNAQLEAARAVDLLSYLQVTEPLNLRKTRTGEYCTAEHDSLKISNGKWYWHSQGFGGYGALDYLVKVKKVPFSHAVQMLADREYPPVSSLHISGIPPIYGDGLP